RLFYVVPRHFVDAVLPLTIEPVPAQLQRVFVGRIELVTPATANSVEAALHARDNDTLRKYGRFLNPILRIMLDREPNSARAQRLDEEAAAFYRSEYWQVH